MFTRLNSVVIASLFLFIGLSACADVGEAPRAETGDAVEVSGGEGRALPIDTSRSTVNWKAAKVTRAHDGGIRDIDGQVWVADGDVQRVEVRMDTRSIWSDTERLTGHLKSDDFFHVEQYPEASFVADQFAPTDSAGATHLVTGNLTMHGQTSSVTFPATIRTDGEAVHASADFIIDRTRWGINYKGQADDLIEQDVRIILDIVAAPTAGMDATASVEQPDDL